jgi:hypothetical protein
MPTSQLVAMMIHPHIISIRLTTNSSGNASLAPQTNFPTTIQSDAPPI